MPGLGGVTKPPASSALKQNNSGLSASAVSRKLGFCRSVAGDLAVLSGGRSIVGLGVTFIDGVASRHILVIFNEFILNYGILPNTEVIQTSSVQQKFNVSESAI